MVHDAAVELAGWLARAAQSMEGERSQERTVARVVELAALAVPGAAHAGIAVLDRHRRLRSVASTDELVEAVDAAQSECEQGGIVMERRKVSSARAFEMLVTVSQRLNVKLRDLAEHVVLTGQDPFSVVTDDLPGWRPR